MWNIEYGVRDETREVFTQFSRVKVYPPFVELDHEHHESHRTDISTPKLQAYKHTICKVEVSNKCYYVTLPSVNSLGRLEEATCFSTPFHPDVANEKISLVCLAKNQPLHSNVAKYIFLGYTGPISSRHVEHLSDSSCESWLLRRVLCPIVEAA